MTMVEETAQSGHSSPQTARLRELDKRHIWHPFTPMKLWLESEPLVITEAQGFHLIDSEGRRYIDGVSSLWCNVHGHRVAEIDEAVRRQLDRVAHTTMLGLASEPAIELADRLMRIVPAGLTKVFYSDAGATATEVAFKLAAQYWHNIGKPAKKAFVGLGDAYHGDTFGAMSVGRTEAFHRAYWPMLFQTHVTPTPFVYRYTPTGTPPMSTEAVLGDALAKLRAVLDQHHETIAAVCLEPIVQGAAGMIVHPAGFLAGVRRLCDEYGVLMVADEVAVGFGRTGRMFACEHESVSPDLLCVAKGISGGYLPLAATFTTQRIFDAFLGDPWEGRTFFHGHTYTGNPLACAAAIASLDLFERNRVLQSVCAKAEWFDHAVEQRGLLGSPAVGDIRRKGCMFGIELVEDRQTRRPFDARKRVAAGVCQRLRRRGVIIRNLGDVVVLMPPPAMPVELFAQVVEALDAELRLLPV